MGEDYSGYGCDNQGFSSASGTLTMTNPLSRSKTNSKFIACTPFPKQHIEKVIKKGIAMVEQKVSLQDLVVVLASEDERFWPGLKAFVKGDRVTLPWAKEVFVIDDKEFILVPESEILVTSG